MISGIYMIELDKWGITPGIPEKTDKFNNRPAWNTAAYELAKKNIDGINAAMKYAKDNGTNYVKLPTGKYAVTYPFPIKMLSGITLDLNNSTLKVLFDSDIYSPYYELAEIPYGNKPYHMTGKTIVMDGVENSHIINGKIIGDRIERSFTDVNGNLFDKKENACESTTGIAIDNGSKNCSVSYIDISGYMGDDIAVGSYPKAEEICNFDGNYYKGSLSKETSLMGIEINKEYNFRTNYVDIKNMQIITIRCGIGYDRIPDIRNSKFTLFFYNQNKVCIGYNDECYYLMNILVTPGTKYVRMLIEDEIDRNNLSQFNLLIMISGPQARDVTIDHCTIYDGHRGGIYGSCDNLIIENNTVFNNGTGVMTNRTVVVFPDTTRYQVNCEDSFGQNIVIRNNYIHTGYNSLLLGVLNAEVYGNTMWNIMGITIYTNESTNIHDNIMLDVFNALKYEGTSSNVYRRIEFNNNRVINSTMFDQTKVNNTITLISDNTFTGGSLSIRSAVVDSNIFLKTNLTISACQFNSNSIKKTQFISKYDNILSDNIFEEVDCKNNEKVYYKSCNFVNTGISDEIDPTDIYLEGCTLDYGSTVISKGNTNSSELGYRFFNNCIFNINASMFNIDPKNSNQKGRFQFENCTFNLRDEDLIVNNNSIFSSVNNNVSTIKYIKIKNSKFMAPNEKKELNIGNSILQNNSVIITNCEFINVIRQILDTKISYKECEDNTSIGVPAAIMPNKIVLSDTFKLITVNEKIALQSTIYPSNATNTTVKWSSSNINVANVDAKGNVTGGTVTGTTIIRIETVNRKFSECQIQVQAPVLPTEINVVPKTETLIVGETKKLSVSFAPENTSTMYKDISWSSADSKIVEVDNQGNVKGNKEGKTIITAITKSNAIKATAKIFVSVQPAIKVQGISISSKVINMKVSETVTITAKVIPDNATFNGIEWEVSDGTLVTLASSKNGECKITANYVGQGIIKAISEEGRFTESCNLNIVSNVEGNPPVQGGLIMWLNSNDGTGNATTWYDRTQYKNDVNLVNFNFDNITNGWINGSIKLRTGSKVECKKSITVKTVEICGLYDDKVNTPGEIAFFTALPETIDSTRFSYRVIDKFNRTKNVSKIYRYYNFPSYESTEAVKFGEFFYAAFEITTGFENFISGIEFGMGPAGATSKHTFFSIRLYNRLLTEAERQQNLAYDKNRLGIK